MLCERCEPGNDMSNYGQRNNELDNLQANGIAPVKHREHNAINELVECTQIILNARNEFTYEQKDKNAPNAYLQACGKVMNIVDFHAVGFFRIAGRGCGLGITFRLGRLPVEILLGVFHTYTPLLKLSFSD